MGANDGLTQVQNSQICKRMMPFNSLEYIYMNVFDFRIYLDEHLIFLNIGECVTTPYTTLNCNSLFQ